MGVLKMMEAAVLRNHIYEPVPKWLKEVPDNLKIQGMCEKAMRINPVAFFLFPTALRLKRCVMLQRAWNHTF